MIDERRGRLIADRFNLQYTGVLGILVEAKSRGFVAAVKPLMDDLIDQAGFWIAPALYDRVLQVTDEVDAIE